MPDNKKLYEIGDVVTIAISLAGGRKLKVKGKVKEKKTSYGKIDYLITEGVVEDFPTRSII